MNILRRLNWTNTLFLTLTPLLAIIGIIFIATQGTFHLATLWFAIIFFISASLAVTVGYHRLFSHRSYRAAWPVRLVWLLLGAATFEGSAIEWSSDHRRHHLYTDTDRDPYSINKGFWFAHMGWLFMLDRSKRDFSNVQDLMADPLVRLQHRFYTPIAITMGFIFPLLLAALWGDAWGGLIIAGALRITLTQQMTFCINSVSHTFGKRTYSEQSARDNWFTALFTFGEGFHNFHHQFAIDYRNGVRAYHFDPSKWLIATLSYLGLAKDLKRVSQEQIIRYRVESQQKQLRELAQLNAQQETIEQQMYHFVQPLYARILKVVAHMEQLKKDYRALKKAKLEHYQGRITRYHRYVAAYKLRLKKTQAELKDALSMWSKMVRNYG